MPAAAIIPAVASIGSAAIGAMASKGGGKTQTVQQQASAPWGPQQTPLQDLFGDATNTYHQQLTSGPYTGQLYAGWTPAQQDAANAYISNGQTTGNYAPGVMSAGYSGLSGLPTATNTATDFAAGNFAKTNPWAANTAAGNAGNMVAGTNAGVAGALTGIGNNTASNVATQAGSLINNDVLNGQIDAIGTDIRRNLTENTLPTLNAQAIAGGNLNSSRAGAAEAIATRGAQENLANAAATLRGNAYATGLNLAEGINQGNINANTNVAGVSNSGLNTALTGTTVGNNINSTNNSTQLAGAGLAGTLANTDTGILTQGSNLGALGAAQQAQGGSMQQTEQQNQLNAQLQQWQNNMNFPWQVMNNASGIIQARNWGGTSDGSTTSTQSTSPLGNAIGGGMLGYTLGNGFVNSDLGRYLIGSDSSTGSGSNMFSSSYGYGGVVPTK